MKIQRECWFHRNRVNKSVPATRFLESREPMCRDCFEGKSIDWKERKGGERCYAESPHNGPLPGRTAFSIYGHRKREQKQSKGAIHTGVSAKYRKRGLPRAA